MKLEMIKRQVGKTGENNRLRREGRIPVVVYGPSRQPEGFSIEKAQWESSLRQIPKGSLSITIFTLHGDQGSMQALVKEIQYHPTSYEVLHLDFIEVKKDVRVNVKVPLRFIGADECAGVKQGGVFRPVFRSIKVNCLPDQIPKELTLDVTEMGMKQNRRLSALAMPEGVRALANLNEVAAVIAKR